MNRLILLSAFALCFWLWRQQKRGSLDSMSMAEAAKLLDVPQYADKTTVNTAYKRLIARVHPDMGGSAELAARVNQARDVMLKK